ncbi:MAG: hypothetical protein SFU21_10530 [Flavihumibacter sp.]|nr:hypothetical protein [Flavihumibacter sp.]
MSEQTPFNPEANKLPSGLNVLTILTFIGCGLGLIMGVWNFFGAKKGLDAMEEMINSGKVDDMPAFARSFYSPEALEQARIAYENRLPIFIIGIVGITLCFYGALQMRKLKSQGYLMYLIGELLPFVGYIIFVGMSSITGMGGIIGLVIAGLFILLYTMQRKYLVHK